MDELVSPTYMLENAPPEIPEGPQAIKHVVSMYRAAFSDLKITIDDLLAEGDVVAARSTMRGIHTGTFFGISPTGKAVKMASQTMVRISNGRLAQSWVSNDLMGLMKQLGVRAA